MKIRQRHYNAISFFYFKNHILSSLCAMSIFFVISCQGEDDTTPLFPASYQFPSTGGIHILRQNGNREMSLYINNTMNPGVEYITGNDFEYGGEHTKTYPYIQTDWLKIKKVSDQEIELTATENNSGKKREFRFSVMGYYEEDQKSITIKQTGE